MKTHFTFADTDSIYLWEIIARDNRTGRGKQRQLERAQSFRTKRRII